MDYFFFQQPLIPAIQFHFAPASPVGPTLATQMRLAQLQMAVPWPYPKHAS
jgi:hypothetical protein